MLRHGVLARYLPAFGAIVGQMQFDMFHTYTVDAHTMQVIANCRRFLRADYTNRFPVTTRIAERLRNPSLLFLAALFHDIAKGEVATTRSSARLMLVNFVKAALFR